MKRTPLSQQHLHQVTVVMNGRRIPIGPAVKESVAREWAGTIRKNIIDGKEKDWKDPQVVPANGGATLH